MSDCAIKTVKFGILWFENILWFGVCIGAQNAKEKRWNKSAKCTFSNEQHNNTAI